MKNISILLIFYLLGTTTHAQTFEEWFEQKQTQKKYLLEQIAALKVYSNYLEKGYKILEFGLNTISEFKNGDLEQHTGYFSSLQTINPNIQKLEKGEDIYAIHSNIIKIYEGVSADIHLNQEFKTDEVAYIHRVFSRLLEACSKVVNALDVVTSSGKLEMKDNERMQYIDLLHLEMQDQYTFARSFRNEVHVLAAARLNSKNELQKTLTLYGLKTE